MDKNALKMLQETMQEVMKHVESISDNRVDHMIATGAGLKVSDNIAERYVYENYLPSEILVLNDQNKPNIKLKNIKVIDLKAVVFLTVPLWVREITWLEGIILNRDSIYDNVKVYFEDIMGFKNLKVAGLMATNFTDFSKISILKELECLDISGNSLGEFPNEVCKLSKLKYLDVSTYNNIPIIPSCIGNLIKLKILRAHYNEIYKIPQEIGELLNLERLILGNNKLKSIPESIYKLEKLKEFDIFINNIEYINVEKLSKIKGLDELYVGKNPLKNFPKEILKEGGKTTSLALRRYIDTGVIFDIKKGVENCPLQKRRLLRSARSLLIRSLYYSIKLNMDKAFQYSIAAYTLSSKLKYNKFCILSGVFSRLFEVIIENKNNININMDLLLSNKYIDNISFNTDNQGNINSSLYYANNLIKILPNLSVDEIRPEKDVTYITETVFENNYEFLKVDRQEEEINIVLRETTTSKNKLAGEINAYTEMNNRDLVRGLIETFHWDDAWNEFSFQHKENQDTYNLSNYSPSNKAEVFMYIFQLTNRDKIRVLLNFYNKKEILEIDSLSINVNEITNMILSRKSGLDKAFYKGATFSERSYNIVFGAYIVSLFTIYEETKTDMTKRPVTLDAYLKENNIYKISIFPSGSLVGVPFFSAYNSNKSCYLIDSYEISNHPSFLCSRASEKKHKSSFLVNDSLPFSSGEYLLINKLMSCEVVNCKKKEEMLDSLKESKIIHVISHAHEMELQLKYGDMEYTVTPEDIIKLDLSGCELVFLNACRTSEEAQTSLINRSLLPLKFLSAGVQHVISTVSEVKDEDAFRFSVRYYELINEYGSLSYSSVFHNLLKECKDNKVPFYSINLKECGLVDLCEHMLYKEKFDATPLKSWRFFTFWENNY